MRYYDYDGYSNIMDPFDVDHNPFNAPSMTEFYIYLLAVIVGLCFLVWAGYLQYRGKNNVALLLGGIFTTGYSFVNILSVRLSETNVVLVAFLIFVHYIICYLILEGSTRHFILKNEKRIKNKKIY
jgi:hypothetical protein